MKQRRRSVPFPDKDQILQFIREQAGYVGKRELARAFDIKPDRRADLRKMLRELEGEGALERGHRRRFHPSGQLPEVTVLDVIRIDKNGEVLARPAKPRERAAGRIVIVEGSARSPAVGIGDRVLARLKRVGAEGFEARIIRRLTESPTTTLGIFGQVGEELRVSPLSRRARDEFIVDPGETGGAEMGELVRVEVGVTPRLGLRRARVIECLGPKLEPKTISIVTAYEHDLPMAFSAEAVAEAEAATAAPLEGRRDLRSLPLVTIDGADARDFDDAVWAEPDTDAKNPGGWHLMVAIADVAWYVAPGCALDRDAHWRGNSVYFPDRVLPMLPEVLSNGWCSLKPDADRPCLVAHLWIDAAGTLMRHRFERALMRSRARLTYEAVQAMENDRLSGSSTVDPSLAQIIEPLFGAYAVLERGREARGVLDLDVAERQVFLNEDGGIERIVPRQRLTSHRLIEEFMITANVAAAETLERKGLGCLYRIHDEPSKDKLESLRQFLETVGMTLPRQGIIRAGDLNHLLSRMKDRPQAHVLNEVVLRSQAQAEYSPDNIGHFGLALRRYCHFTSPIRRYADLVVHRALVSTLEGGAAEMVETGVPLMAIAEHVSMTERRAVAAERDALARYVASYHAHHIGAEFPARVSGVARFGLFITIESTGADALVPVSLLPEDHYRHEAEAQALVGRHSRLRFTLGMPVTARLEEARPETGGLVCSLLGIKAPGRAKSLKRRAKPAGKKRGKSAKKH